MKRMSTKYLLDSCQIAQFVVGYDQNCVASAQDKQNRNETTLVVLIKNGRDVGDDP
jgi:hypothetical protein